MAYVPQFIPTNTQALQGTLDQYQRAYDANTNVANQANDIYSSIPTTNQFDTTEKNRIMSEFQKKTIDELDKKYNYDRSNSQYAKELAREITNLRSNPLWTLVQERENINKTRQNVIANKGSDYYENFNPDTINDINQLKNWKPMDLKDMERQVAMNAKEHSTSMRPSEQIRRPVPGILEITNQTGFKDIESATEWLSQPEGQSWLEQSVKGTGFENHLSDPQVRARAMNAALSQLVGEPDRKLMGDPMWDAEQADIKARRAAALKAGPAWGKVSTMGDIDPYNTKSFSNFDDTKAELEKVNKQLSDPFISEDQKSNLLEQQNALQLDIDKVTDLYNDVIKTPNGVKVITTGKNIIRDIVRGDSINVDKAFKTLESNFTNSSAFGRREGVQEIRGVYENMLSPTSDLIGGISQLGRAMFRSILPMNDIESNQKRIQEATNIIANAIGHKKVKTEDKGKIAMAHQLAEEQIKENLKAGKYGDVINYVPGTREAEMMDKRITTDWKTLFPDFYKVAKEFDRYYQGKGSYVNRGYKDNIEGEINKTLSSGKTQVADVYAAPVDIEPADLKKVPTFLSDNLQSFEVRENGIDKPLTDKEVEKINALFVNKEGADKAGTSVQIAINSESDPTLILKAPTGEKFQLKMNIEAMSDDVARQLVSITGLPQIMDVRYKDIKFANKTYTLNDNYLKNILSKRYSKVEPFKDISITQNENNKSLSYTVTLPQFKDIYGGETVTFNTKYGMMSTLDELYRDYIINGK